MKMREKIDFGVFTISFSQTLSGYFPPFTYTRLHNTVFITRYYHKKSLYTLSILKRSSNSFSYLRNMGTQLPLHFVNLK